LVIDIVIDKELVFMLVQDNVQEEVITQATEEDVFQITLLVELDNTLMDTLVGIIQDNVEEEVIGIQAIEAVDKE
jgi:hypothetical protein